MSGKPASSRRAGLESDCLVNRLLQIVLQMGPEIDGLIERWVIACLIETHSQHVFLSAITCGQAQGMADLLLLQTVSYRRSRPT